MFAHLFKAALVIFLIFLFTWVGIQLDVDGNTILWFTLASVIVIGFVTLERQSREIRIIRTLLEDQDSPKVIKGNGAKKQVLR